MSVKWNKEEIRQLKKLYRNTSNKEVAKALGRTPAAVKGKAADLGLTKTKKYLKTLGR